MSSGSAGALCSGYEFVVRPHGEGLPSFVGGGLHRRPFIDGRPDAQDLAACFPSGGGSCVDAFKQPGQPPTCEHGESGPHRHGGDAAGLALRCPGPSTPEFTSGGTP